MNPKGPWIHRFSIRLFTLFLAVLVYWVLGFLVQDIESVPGPSYDDIEQRYIDVTLVETQKILAADIAEADRAIAGRREEMQIISDSTRNLQSTISQLIELQKLTVQKSAVLPETEQVNLSDSLARFLDNQTRYQTLNTELSRLTEQKQDLAAEKRQVDQRIEQLKSRPGRNFSALEKNTACVWPFTSCSFSSRCWPSARSCWSKTRQPLLPLFWDSVPPSWSR